MKECCMRQGIQIPQNTITKLPLIITTNDDILTIALSPDNRHIASVGYKDLTISIWDLLTGDQVGECMQGHQKQICSINYSRCGNFLASASYDYTIRQWDVSTQKQIGDPLTGHSHTIYRVQYTHDQRYICSYSNDDTIRLWDQKTRKEDVDKQISAKRIQHLSLSPNQNKLVWGDYYDTIFIWNYEERLQIKEVKSKDLKSIDYSTDGKWIVSGHDDKTIWIWDAEALVQIRKCVVGQRSDIDQVGFSHNSKYMVCVGQDTTFRIWDQVSGKYIGQTLIDKKQSTQMAKYTLDGKYIITGVQKQIKIMTPIIAVNYTNPQKNTLIQIMKALNDIYSQMDVTQQITFEQVELYPEIDINDLTDDMLYQITEPSNELNDKQQSGLHYIKVSLFEQIIILETLLSMEEPIVEYYILLRAETESSDTLLQTQLIPQQAKQQTKQCLTQQLRQLQSILKSIEEFIHQQVLISGMKSDIQTFNQIRQEMDKNSTGHYIKSEWNVITAGKPLIIKSLNNIRSIALSPDGKYIAATGRNSDYYIRIWDPKSGNQVGNDLKGHWDLITSINYSRCGNYIVSCSQDYTIRQWNVSTQQQIGEPIFQDNYIGRVQYSPNQIYIVYKGYKQISFWDPTTGKQHIDQNIKYEKELTCISLSPISSEVAFAGYFDEIIIWDYEKKRKSGESLKSHFSKILCLQYSSDGKWIISGSNDQTIRIWDAERRTQIGSCYGHEGDVLQVSFSPNLKYIISMIEAGSIRIWDRISGIEIGQISTADYKFLNSVQFSLDGESIIIVSDYSQITVQSAIKVNYKNPSKNTLVMISKALNDLYTEMGINQQTFEELQVHSQIEINALTDDLRYQIIESSNELAQKQKWGLNQIKDNLIQQTASLQESLALIKNPNSELLQTDEQNTDISTQQKNENLTQNIYKLQEIQTSIETLQQKQLLISKLKFDIQAFNQIEESSIKQHLKSEWDTITLENPMIIEQSNAITSIAQSPDGKYIASVGEALIKILDPITKHQVGDDLKGHQKKVNSINYSNCGNYIVSASADCTIRQWNVSTQQQIGEPIFGHKEEIYCAYYTPDVKYIVSGSCDGTIRFWDRKTGKEYVDKQIHLDQKIQSLSLSPIISEVAFVDCRSHMIMIWDYEKNTQIKSAQTYRTTRMNSIQYSFDGKLIALIDSGESISIWDAETLSQLKTFVGGEALSISFSPNSKYIISASQDNTARIWDRVSGKQIGQGLTSSTHRKKSVQFSIDGRYIITAGQDQQITIMKSVIAVHYANPQRNTLIKIREGINQFQQEMDINQQLQNVQPYYQIDINDLTDDMVYQIIEPSNELNDKELLTLNQTKEDLIQQIARLQKELLKEQSNSETLQGVISKSDLQTQTRKYMKKQIKELQEILTYTEEFSKKLPLINLLKADIQAFQQFRQSIDKGSIQQLIKSEWNTITHETPLLIKQKNEVSEIILSPDGKYIASAQDRCIRIWDPITGNQVGNDLQGHTSTINSINYSYCGNFIVSGGDETIRQWNVSTQHQIGEAILGHKNNVSFVQYCPDQTYIISCSPDQTIRFWDANTGKEHIDKVIKLEKYIELLSFSPICNQVAIGGDFSKIIIWDYEQNQKSGQPLKGHTKRINSIKYSFDGKLIVSGSNDKTIRIWDPETHIQIAQFDGHTDYVKSVNFSPDLKFIISGSDDATARVWDRVSGKQIGENLVFSDSVRTTQFSLDGKYIIIGGNHKEITIMLALIN